MIRRLANQKPLIHSDVVDERNRSVVSWRRSLYILVSKTRCESGWRSCLLSITKAATTPANKPAYITDQRQKAIRAPSRLTNSSRESIFVFHSSAFCLAVSFASSASSLGMSLEVWACSLGLRFGSWSTGNSTVPAVLPALTSAWVFGGAVEDVSEATGGELLPFSAWSWFGANWARTQKSNGLRRRCTDCSFRHLRHWMLRWTKWLTRGGKEIFSLRVL